MCEKQKCFRFLLNILVNSSTLIRLLTSSSHLSEPADVTVCSFFPLHPLPPPSCFSLSLPLSSELIVLDCGFCL